jgi:hypothetical protein
VWLLKWVVIATKCAAKPKNPSGGWFVIARVPCSIDIFLAAKLALPAGVIENTVGLVDE